METYKSTVEKMYELQFYNNLLIEIYNLKAELNQLETKTMRNQFFYTYEYTVAPEAPTRANVEPIVLTKMASFNIEKVIRTVEIEDGKLIVILDDFHEETRQGVKNNANGKPIVTQEKVMLQSEIHLNIEDKERFRKVTSVPFPLSLTEINNLEVITDNGV